MNQIQNTILKSTTTKLQDPQLFALLNRKRFCVWKYQQLKDNNKPSKVPYRVKSGKLLKTNIKLQKYWLTGYTALKIAETDSRIDGIGIILTGSNIFAIDLDYCLDPNTGNLSKQAQDIVEMFSKTYIEISPSNQGLHILGQGKLNLYGRNKSPKNQNIEAYDGSSIRYIAITGNLWNNVTKLYLYSQLSSPIQWFQTTFFPKTEIGTNQPIHTSNTLSNTVSSNQLTDSLNLVISRIKSSKTYPLFKQLCQGIKVRKSTSEDDWLFCKIVSGYIPKNASPKEVLRQMLSKYRYRTKLERLDYVNQTINKILLKNSSISKNHNKYSISTNTKNIQITIPHSHVIKSCPMLQSIFTLSKRQYNQDHEYTIWQDNNNNVTIRLLRSLGAMDLNTYIALVLLSKQKILLNPRNQDDLTKFESGNTSPDYINFKTTFVELSRILRKTDGGRFRKNILETIQNLSDVKIRYKKSINTSNPIIQGRSNLLNWYITENEHQNNYIYVGINKLAWSILQQATINYCSLNVNAMFQLPAIELQFLYNYICYVCPINCTYFTKISMKTLVHTLWFPASNPQTYRSRKTRVRKWCQQLFNLQNQLIDVTIHLVHKQISNHFVIDQMLVKRYKAKLLLNSEVSTNRLKRIHFNPHPKLPDSDLSNLDEVPF